MTRYIYFKVISHICNCSSLTLKKCKSLLQLKFLMQVHIRLIGTQIETTSSQVFVEYSYFLIRKCIQMFTFEFSLVEEKQCNASHVKSIKECSF